MKFGRITLGGEWLCERCGRLTAPLQISPLNDNGLRCPTCWQPLVFVPDFRPVELEEGKRLFAVMHMTAAGNGK